MEKTTENTESRILAYLEKRLPTKVSSIAKAMGMSKNDSIKEYKMVANLLRKMHLKGKLLKPTTGYYRIASPTYNSNLDITRVGDLRKEGRKIKTEFGGLEGGVFLQTENKGTLRAYRLIKNYPNSPHQVGHIIEAVRGTEILGEYPDNWQPIYEAKKELTKVQKDLLQDAHDYMEVALSLVRKAIINNQL